jgi:hypothetical protein
MKRAAIALLLAGCLTAAGAATAQEAPRSPDSAAAPAPAQQHNGFWFSGGAGGGWRDDLRGAAVYVRLGGTPSGRALFGGEVITWFRGEQESLQRVNVTATALFYPLYGTGNAAGLFFKGGFGVATTGGGRTGVGTTLGTGYDFRLGRNLFVTPNVDFLVQFFESWTDTALVITLGMGFH